MSDDDLKALKDAKPSWMGDNLGVRGVPVAGQSRTTKIEWADSQVTRSEGVKAELKKSYWPAGADVPASGI